MSLNREEFPLEDTCIRFNFNSDLQLKICAVLVRKKDVFIRLYKLVKPDYFGEKFLSSVYKIVVDYYGFHRELPDRSIVANELLKSVKTPEMFTLYKVKLNNLYSLLLDEDDSYIISIVRTFAKRLHAIKLINNFQKAIDSVSSESDIDRVYNRLKMDLRNSVFHDDLGVEVFSSPDIRSVYSQRSFSMKKYVVPTGLSIFDRKTGGGLESGEVGTILGSTGVGKSHFLINFCKAAALSSCPYIDENNEIVYNPVIYISQELSEEDIHDRFLASFSGLPIYFFSAYKHRPNILNKEETEAVEKVLEGLKNLDYYVRIKYFKPKQVTVQMIHDYIYEVEQVDKVKVRGLFHDYMKKISYEDSAKDDYKGLGYICTQLIALAQDFNIPVWSPMQLNRFSRTTDSNTAANIANSWEIVEDLDVVLVLNLMTSSSRSNSEVTMKVLVDKCRRAEDKYEFFTVLDKNCSRLSELEELNKETSNQGRYTDKNDYSKDNQKNKQSNTFSGNQFVDDAPF